MFADVDVKMLAKGNGEMVPRLRALSALPEILSSISSNHMRSGVFLWPAGIHTGRTLYT